MAPGVRVDRLGVDAGPADEYRGSGMMEGITLLIGFLVGFMVVSIAQSRR